MFSKNRQTLSTGSATSKSLLISIGVLPSSQQPLGVGGRIALEGLLAAGAAEVVGLPLVLRAPAGRADLDGHPAHGVGFLRLLTAGGPGGRRCRGERAGSAQLHQLGQDG